MHKEVACMYIKCLLWLCNIWQKMKYISDINGIKKDINDKVDKNRKEMITPAGKMNREHSSFKTSFPVVHCWYMRYRTNNKSSCYGTWHGKLNVSLRLPRGLSTHIHAVFRGSSHFREICNVTVLEIHIWIEWAIFHTLSFSVPL